MMKFSYDPKVDALRLRLSDMRFADSDEVAPGVIVDYDENGQVTAIKILDVHARNEQINVDIPDLLVSAITPSEILSKLAASIQSLGERNFVMSASRNKIVWEVEEVEIPRVQTGVPLASEISIHKTHTSATTGHAAKVGIATGSTRDISQQTSGVPADEQVEDKGYPVG